MQTQGVQIYRDGLMAVLMGVAALLLLADGTARSAQVAATGQVIGTDRQDDLAWG
ncbi:hypothetical protein ABZ467_31925 [Streptomyces sp. NPDC005727]|uniref:hypothetical protein n=1 Tax=unclassified Streptomyces TaxID=2593676 RepID=UPI0033E78689